MEPYLQYILYYFAFINFIAAIAFYADKRKAVKNKFRVSEIKLHVFELLGGVLIILPMLYLIRHKNRKSSYYFWTYLIFIGWLISAYLINTNFTLF